MKTCKNSSFTLIEIMIVVVIVGVVTAFAIPNYGKMMRRTKWRAAWDNFMAMHTADRMFFAKYGAYLPTAALPGCEAYNIGCNIYSLDDINRGLNLALIGENDYFYGCGYGSGACPGHYACHPRCWVISPVPSVINMQLIYVETYPGGGFRLDMRMDLPISGTNPTCYGNAEACSYFNSLH